MGSGTNTLATESRGTRVTSSLTRGTSSGSGQSRGTSGGIGATAGKVAEVGLREEVERLKAENKALRLELDILGQSTRQELPDLEEMRDRILKSLKLGHQAPGYKVARKVLEQFIGELTP